MAVAAIVGSAFQAAHIGETPLTPIPVDTPFGQVILHHYPTNTGDAYVLFRHGLPHRWLPNQIPYRAHAYALSAVGCKAVLITSSVGVLDPQIPLDRPLLVEDLLMPDNRLPDGSACSIFPESTPGQGHLVIEEGLFSVALSQQIDRMAQALEWPIGGRVTFAYVGGPRTKTAAENRYWASTGAQVNSMTLAPEVVLANELEIPVAGVVVGHKYSVPTIRDPLDQRSISASLTRSQQALTQLICRFLESAEPPEFANRIYRFHQTDAS